MNLFIMGAPGSGKGTFSSQIKEAFNLNHISTGDIFRANLKNETPLGLEAKGYMEKGLLVPDELTNEMVKDYLMNLEDQKSGYLLDGYPRTLAQAQAFEQMVKGSSLEPDVVLAMDIERETLTKRITGRRSCPSCGEIYNIYSKAPTKEGICDRCGSELTQRKDDNEESLAVRLNEYDRNTTPVLDYYEQKGIVIHIDAQGSLDTIWQRIESALKSK